MPIIKIDKESWYEDRGIYANKYEIMIHFVHNKQSQDILTCFEKEPSQEQVIERLKEITTRLDVIPEQEMSIEVSISSYTPKQVYDMIATKKIDEKTTWSQVFEGKLGVSIK